MSREDFEIFKEREADRKKRRQERLAKADTDGWNMYCSTHYWLQLPAGKIDWWPSANKWCYQKKYYRGGLPRWIHDLIESVLDARG